MQQNHTHIITSAGWHTAFENKERAQELQEKLSNWCHWRMPHEIMSVFDKMCPPDQVWRINTLQLDLGTIDLDELETTLAVRFRQCLYEAMRERVYYAGRPGADNGIEMVDTYTNLLDKIATFLTTGYLPWNALPTQGSINDWIDWELRHNRRPLIALIRQVAAGNEPVRKRLVWQVADPSIRNIIAGLEPAHHNQITEFADELVKLQKNSPVVKASTGDFTKNCWLWILNYLLEEKGTLFNKVAFLRSNIRQMAAHYNMQYAQVLQLLQQAVAILQQKSTVKTHFVNMLLLVAQELSTMPMTEQHLAPATDDWAVLKRLLTNPLQWKTSTGLSMLNELLVSLHPTNPSKLARLLADLSLPQDTWASLAQGLTADSVQVLFECAAPSNAQLLLQAIELLHNAAKQQQVVVNIRVLWQAGLVWLWGHRAEIPHQSELLQACIKAIAKAKNRPAVALYGLLLTADLPATMYSPTALQAYHDLQQICSQGLAQSAGSTAIEQPFHQLLAGIKQLLSSSTAPSHAWWHRLHHGLRQQPRACWNALVASQDEHLLLQIILPRLSIAEINLLLPQAGAEQQQAYTLLMDTLRQTATSESDAIAQRLPHLTMALLLRSPRLSVRQLMRTVLHQLLLTGSVAERRMWEQITLDASTHPQVAAWLGSAVQKSSCQYRYIFHPRFWQRVKNLGPMARQTLLHYLAKQFNDAAFANLRQQNSAPATALMQVLCKEAPLMMNKLVAQYADWLQQKGGATASSQVATLRHLFWKALLHLSAQALDTPSVVARAFAAAVAAHYSFNRNEMPMPITTMAAVPIAERSLRLNGEACITTAQLFDLLEKSWLAQGRPVEYEGRQYTLGQLMDTALRTEPAMLRHKLKTIAQRPLTAARLATAIGFVEFGTWIMQDSAHQPATTMAQLTKLYSLASRLLSGSVLARWEQQCWLLALSIVGDNINPQAMRLLATHLLEQAAQQSGATPATVAAQIKQAHLVNDPAFVQLLQQAQPILAPALSGVAVTNPAQPLAQAAQNGLLGTLVQQLLFEQTIPHWLVLDDGATAAGLLHQLLIHYPSQTLQVWHPMTLHQRQLEWIGQHVDFDSWIQALVQVEKTRQSSLSILHELHRALGHIAFKSIDKQVLQGWLFKKLIQAWQSGHWRIVAAETILNELLWELHTRWGITQQHFVEVLSRQRSLLPPALQTAFTLIFEQRPTTSPTAKPLAAAIAAPAKVHPPTVLKSSAAVPTLLVKNAGLVLLNSYVPLLFDRLGLLHDKTFAQPSQQEQAVHFLQYVVTGHTATEEHWLPLNKVLCGLPLETPVQSSIDMLPEQKELIGGLLQAAINYWPAIGQNSLDGFRGNWLVRDGHLSDQGDNWHLLVDKRPYDILIGQSPFSFSVIKFPWMPKPLKVTWPY